MTSITTSDGVRLDYRESGDPGGRPIVLIAGFLAPISAWRYQLSALEKAGRRIIAVDLRDHGTSEAGSDEGFTMDRRGDDLAEVLEQLDLRDADVVGQSMGGNTIWAHLARHPADRLRRIVIADQTPKMLNTDDWPFGFYGYEPANRDSYFAAGVPDTGHGTPIAQRGMRLARLLRALPMPSGDPADRFTPNRLRLLHDHATRDWRDVIAGSPLPVLFVAGAVSELWPSGHAAAAAALAPEGASTVIADAGHAVNIEQPRGFNRALLEFVA